MCARDSTCLRACMQRDKRMQLSWACEEQLFRQEMENADDIRLSVRLFSKCLADKRKVRGQGWAGCKWDWGACAAGSNANHNTSDSREGLPLALRRGQCATRGMAVPGMAIQMRVTQRRMSSTLSSAQIIGTCVTCRMRPALCLLGAGS